MANNHLDKWMDASNEALSDYINQILDVYDIDVKKQIDTQPKQLHGSILKLNCSNYNMYIYFLAEQKDIQALTRRVLDLSPNEEVSNEDIHDVMKEANNVLSGGIKSRMSEFVPSEILLSIPDYVEFAPIFNQKEWQQLSQCSLPGMTLYLGIEHMDLEKEISEEDLDDEKFQYEALIEQLRFEKQDYADQCKALRALLRDVFEQHKQQMKWQSEEPVEKLSLAALRELFKLK